MSYDRTHYKPHNMMRSQTYIRTFNCCIHPMFDIKMLWLITSKTVEQDFYLTLRSYNTHMCGPRRNNYFFLEEKVTSLYMFYVTVYRPNIVGTHKAFIHLGTLDSKTKQIHLYALQIKSSPTEMKSFAILNLGNTEDS